MIDIFSLVKNTMVILVNLNIQKSTAPSSTHKKKRCQYFPQCKKSDADCPFFHPFQMCRLVSHFMHSQYFGKHELQIIILRNLPAGRKCPGQWCLYKHGACANDGSCTDLKCVYEHFKVCLRSICDIYQPYFTESASIPTKAGTEAGK